MYALHDTRTGDLLANYTSLRDAKAAARDRSCNRLRWTCAIEVWQDGRTTKRYYDDDCSFVEVVRP